jgi:hypothetical protein
VEVASGTSKRKAPGARWLSWLLIALAAVSAGLIAALIGWGGRIEVSLLVFGEPVQLKIDAAQPRIWLLPVVPVLLLGAALVLRRPAA